MFSHKIKSIQIKSIKKILLNKVVMEEGNSREGENDERGVEKEENIVYVCVFSERSQQYSINRENNA